ncbi:MAG: hypothetical protein ACM3PY_15505, partial [Omnitrophica WOR_2 bacterium]
ENVDGDWRSIRIRNARISKADMRVQTVGGFEAVEVSSLQGKKEFDLELHRYRSKKLERHNAGRQKVQAGMAVRLAPRDWNALDKDGVESNTRKR